MNTQKDFNAHNNGKRHNINKFLDGLDYAKIDSVSTLFRHLLTTTRSQGLIVFGLEYFVSFNEADTTLLYSTATGIEYHLPKVNNEGQIIDEKTTKEYYAFIDSLQHYYHLAHSIRLVDLSTYKTLTNWPPWTDWVKK